MTDDAFRQRMDALAIVEAKRLFREYVEEWERKRNLELNELLLQHRDLVAPKDYGPGSMLCSCKNQVSLLYPWKYPCPYCGRRFGS